MDRIEKLKKFLQQHLPNKQAFNTTDWYGDSKRIVYISEGIIVLYCEGYNYVEILGLTDEEFDDLLEENSDHLKTFKYEKE